jgi:tripartite-type tricarboxylate transporter receptor subunit TctC
VVAFPFALLNSLHPQAKIEVTRDFVPLAWAGSTPNLLVVPAASPYRSVRELIAAAKAKPAGIPYASTGNGTSNHLSMELFKVMAAVDLTHVPYKGSAPAVTDLIGGQVQAMFDNVPNVINHVRAGKLRALAITSAKRAPSLADIVTVDEAGVPGYQVNVWFGVVAATGTPRDAVTRLNAEINRVLVLPEVRERFGAAGIDIVGGAPEVFGNHVREQVATWGKVVREANIKAD